MAPIGEKTQPLVVSDENTADDDEPSLWASILSEVQSSSSVKLPVGKSVLILGDYESGKTTLVAKLQGTEDPKKGCGLEYHHLDVRDDYIDDQTRLSLWTLDGDPHHTGLLHHTLTDQSFAHTLVMIVISMSTPWSMIDSLKKWITILSDHVDCLQIPYDEMQEYKQSLIRQFQEYVEPESESGPGPVTALAPPRRPQNPLHPPATTQGGGSGADLVPLGEYTFTTNLGLPIVVVVTKSDAISTLEKEHDYREEHFDFIQQRVRNFCLNYGAALCYTSVKEEQNCDLLYKYLLHRIYGFSFNVPAYVVDRNAVFIPSGWDSDSKISILNESMTSISVADSYADIIVKPSSRKQVTRDADVVAEDEQVFLARQMVALSKAPNPRQESPIRPVSNQKSTSQRAVGSPGSITVSPKKVSDAAKPGTSQEGVLANFFNSLLSKKTGSPTTPVKADKAAATRDAAAELDRMNRLKKEPMWSSSSQ